MVIDLLLIVAAYLLGSIPSAVWIGKKFYGVDVREHGSKNAGTTNTLRVLGRRAALPVFIIDVLKGFAAVELCYLSSFYREGDDDMLFYFKIVLAVAAVIGHMLPIFANFKGGKGVATMAGVLLAIAPVPLLLSFITFIIVLYFSHYVSLGSVIAAILFPVYIKFIFHEDTKMVIFGIVLAVVVIFTHRKNIKRLFKGTESKIYLIKKKDGKPE